MVMGDAVRTEINLGIIWIIVFEVIVLLALMIYQKLVELGIV